MYAVISDICRFHLVSIYSFILKEEEKELKINNFIKKINSSQMNKNYINLHDAALYLCVSESKLYKLTHKREIPFLKMGRRNVFKLSDLENFIEKGRVFSHDEYNFYTILFTQLYGIPILFGCKRCM